MTVLLWFEIMPIHFHHNAEDRITRTGKVFDNSPVFKDFADREFIIRHASNRPIAVFLSGEPDPSNFPSTAVIDGTSYPVGQSSRWHSFHSGMPELQYELTEEEKAAHAA